jgi:uncharacterized protein YbjT (DUF2867 family)
MKVLVIGAAGKSGQALVNEALTTGHKVTAFVRGAAQYKKANVGVVAATCWTRPRSTLRSPARMR